jgi:23S rRNA (guanosine2251-2'-O)-methyltransferase
VLGVLLPAMRRPSILGECPECNTFCYLFEAGCGWNACGHLKGFGLGRQPGPCRDNQAMASSPKVLFGFHAVGVRIKTAPQSVLEVFFDASRRDARMRQFTDRAREAGVRLIESDGLRLAKMCGSHGHQGVVARVDALAQVKSLDELLEQLEEAGVASPLLLVLDGVTDPHNLGACLRVADGAGAHAVIAPKDHAAGINATVAKVASGAAETMPYFMVTNLARTLGELKERNIWCIGTSDDAEKTIYDVDLKGPVALVLGAEGEGMRQLTRKTCDELVSIPMQGAVESLNVSVASGVCLYEALRQRRSAS